ncbi:MAG: cell division protein ZapE [Rhodobacteraceae bacterium]|nr:MAG: cell division protein ZapE [Paracoccaceae bacterium]
MTVTQEYDRRVAAGELHDDPNQRPVLKLLEELHRELADYKPSKLGHLKAFFSGNRRAPKGLYIYGGVGRGKSMLMDLFYSQATTQKKRRVHFHAFMQEIHDALHITRKSGVEDALKPVAVKITHELDLLCFDEMQITDITDAMIVGRLFEYLFNAGVVIVTTSNRHPDDLYKSGLNRSIFLPFIEKIKARLSVHCLDSITDHRQNRLMDQQLYFAPLNDTSRTAMDQLWRELSSGAVAPLIIRRKGRDIIIPEFSNGVGKARFSDLCAKALGPGDYLEIAKSVRVLMLTDVPTLGKANNNEAKRFVILIDALYEAGVKLIASADAEPEALYTDGAGVFEFERTASRLREMQSADWAS